MHKYSAITEKILSVMKSLDKTSAVLGKRTMYPIFEKSYRKSFLKNLQNINFTILLTLQIDFQDLTTMYADMVCAIFWDNLFRGRRYVIFDKITNGH